MAHNRFAKRFSTRYHFCDLKIAAIVQARFKSTRLPGKVVTAVGGKPLLQYILERLGQSKRLYRIIVATSVDPSDDPIAQIAKDAGVDFYRGSSLNVADRYRVAAARFELDAFVRLQGNSPLIDPNLVDQAIALYEKHLPDLVTNSQPPTFPRGETVEVVSVPALQRALPEMSLPDDFKDVTHYFYRHADQFRIHNFAADGNFGDVRFAVESYADVVALEEVVQRMSRPHWEYDWHDLLQLYKEATSWLRSSLG
jgi:spore coat polysaccharide biosynthesis protein SpsF